MNRSDYVFALSEREQVTKLLEKSPKGFSLGRISLESRLKNLNEYIAQADLRKYEPTKATITFKGPTVMGTHGISATFGSKAISIFNDAIAYVATAFNGALPSGGRVPNCETNNLMITASARGSFGFVLEEYRPDAPLGFDEPTLVSKAMDRTQTILQASLTDDDEVLTEALDDLDPRALDKIRSFIQYLHENRTVFSLKTNHGSVIFRDPKQLQKTSEKLSADNIHEETIEVKAYFLGALPNKRQCEFLVVGDTEVKTAKISRSIDNPDAINKNLGKASHAFFTKKTIGSGKPRFVLTSLPEWGD